MIKKLILYSPVIIGIILVLFFGIARKFDLFSKGKTTTLTSATLTKTIDIAELSAAEYTYNGIAEKYKEDQPDEVECYIKYNAKIKVGIDMKEVEFKIDHEKKTIRPILPPIEINSKTVDENNLSFIPSDTDIDIKDALIVCEEDAAGESKKSTELIASAKTNLESIIEGLLDPIVKANGYTVVWK